MRLADLAIDPWASGDLEWFYSWSDGEMGLRSNFGAMVAQLESGSAGGGSPTISDVEDRMLARLSAAGDARRTRRALEALAPFQVWILRTVFGPGGREAPGLGLVSPLAPYTTTARYAHEESGTDRRLEEWLYRLCYRCSPRRPVSASSRKKKRDLDRKATESDRRLLDAIRLESETILRGALSAFAAARRRCGR